MEKLEKLKKLGKLKKLEKLGKLKICFRFSQIGSFFMINLCLVVIATQFSETKKREMERMRLERARYHSTSTLASTSASESASCYRQIIKYIAHLWRRNKRRLLRRYRAYRSRKRELKLARLEQQCQLSLASGEPAKRKRTRRRIRRPDPQCPRHGHRQRELKQADRSGAANHKRSSSLRVPALGSLVAVRINDGPADPPLGSSSPKVRRPSVVDQKTSPFLSPRGNRVEISNERQNRDERPLLRGFPIKNQLNFETFMKIDRDLNSKKEKICLNIK